MVTMKWFKRIWGTIKGAERFSKEIAKSILCNFQAVDESIFEKILELETTKEAWVTLQKLYKGNEHVKRMKLQILRGEFKSLCMNDSKSISDYFDWVQTIVNQIWVNDEKLNYQQIVEKIILSLSARFDYAVAAIEERNDIFTLMVEGLMSSLCSHEQQMNRRINSTNLEQALQSRASTGGCGGQQCGRGRGRGKGRGWHNNFNNKDRDGDTDSSKGRGNTSKLKDKSHIQCFRYKKNGHYKSECRTKLQNEQVEQANIVEVE